MRGGTSVVGALVVAGLLVVLGLALVERWQEPASSPVIGAEDPYTHMVFVREHVAHGGFAAASDRIGVGLYPPGMHALVGILWQDSGVDIYQLARWFPLAFGLLAAWGTFALLARHGPARTLPEGSVPWSALVGAALAGFIVATNPEHVVRSDLLFPTGLDLALLPWVMLGIADALAGDRRGLVVAGVLSIALVVAHPWIGFVIAGAGVLAAGLGLVLVPEGERRAADSVLAGLTLAGVALFASIYQKQFDSDKGFGTAGSLAAAIAVVAAFAFFAFRIPLVRTLRGRVGTRVAVAVLAAAGVIAAYWAVLSADQLPLHVNYARMLGWPLLGLLSLGAVAVALRPSSAGLLGLALCAVTFPFTAFDILDSWYLPHRTMVYLIAGAAIVAGHAAAVLVERLGSVRLVATRRAAPLAVAALVLVAGVATVAAGTDEPYVWDRYMTDEEFAVLDRLADRLDASGGRDHVITTSWVANVVLGALCEEDLSHFRDGFFKSSAKREEVLDDFADKGWEPIVVVDSHTLDIAAKKGLDLGFLDSWQVLDRAGDTTVYGRP